MDALPHLSLALLVSMVVVTVVVGIGTPAREELSPCTPARELSLLSLSSTPANESGSMESNKWCLCRSVILRFWMPLDLLRALIVATIAGVAGMTVTKGHVMTW